MGVLALVAVVLGIAAAVLPYHAFLTRPDPVVVAAGLAVAACGLILLREHATGPAGWLLYAAGLAWFLPILDVTDVRVLDTAIRCMALLHVSLLAHAVVVVAAPRATGRLERVTLAGAYAVALTAVLGGYPVGLPALGALLVACVLRTGRALPPAARSWRTAAGLALGLGLVVDAALRWRTGMPAEQIIVVAHPLELAATAALVAIAGTRPSPWRAIEVRLDGTDALTDVLAAQLGVEQVTVALSDGAGGWLRPSGARRSAPGDGAWQVLDGGGTVVAVVEGGAPGIVPRSVEDVVRLAAANARLRRSLMEHLEELEGSRRRLLAAADSERVALGAQLRAGAMTTVAGIERDLRHRPDLQHLVDRAALTRRMLETIARGIDPVASAGSLAGALEDLAATSAARVQIVECVEPESPEVATALWFCCAEAAANTAKHATMATLDVRIRREGDRIVAALVDDGPGGADAEGTGLVGVRDRVAALGGSMRIDSPPGSGTSMLIDLPSLLCGQPQSALRGSADPPADPRSYVRDSRSSGGSS